uniref:Uncharacterized protein n=1 Tax=Candidatus Kentrum eta TaxID=2126337 RepID=A0A450UTU9_9GAMM|nr:MAG: hypothetical protein BECKH772A_GA0070896_100955 [Candidatus Kentron sp. H]VFJ96599.1 MAG: hypothetical protein BECKH772B_GA0070898_100946 [Candidatus Kentron sp. H]VFK02519.1 MAG: hypothetical protein BECKH772C_GA0070978_100935 [Candidatus Kentron sp. H]
MDINPNAARSAVSLFVKGLEKRFFPYVRADRGQTRDMHRFPGILVFPIREQTKRAGRKPAYIRYARPYLSLVGSNGGRMGDGPPWIGPHGR